MLSNGGEGGHFSINTVQVLKYVERKYSYLLTYEKELRMFCALSSQLVLMNPSGQLHLYRSLSAWHRPPCRQGWPAHGWSQLRTFTPVNASSSNFIGRLLITTCTRSPVVVMATASVNRVRVGGFSAASHCERNCQKNRREINHATKFV